MSPKHAALAPGVARDKAALRNERIAFGDLLRQFRIGASLSQEALAERSGLSRRGISDLERGVSVAPRLETVRLLADALVLGERDQQALLTAARPNAWQNDGALRGNTRHDSLPSPLTRLIGRKTEHAALRALLDIESMLLLTVTGSGGTGKTRLALEVAASVRRGDSGGAPVRSGSSIAPRYRITPLDQALGRT